MDNKINLTQLINLYSQVSDMSKNLSEDFVRAFFDVIADNAIAGQPVKVKGFGTFKLTRIEDRESVNVNTGERFLIAGHSKLSFIPDPIIKDLINKPFSDFEVISLNDDADVSTLSEDNASGIADEIGDDSAEVEDYAAEELEEGCVTSSGTNGSPTVAKDGVKKKTAAKKDDGIRRKRGKNVRGLKILLYSCSVILILLMISYCIWPLNLLHILSYNSSRLMEKEESRTEVVAKRQKTTKSVEKVSAATQTEVVAEVQTVEAGSVAEVESETGAETGIQTAPEPVTKPAEQPKTPAALATTPARANTSTLRLLDKDYAKDLSEFTIADTLNYRITGLRTRHVISKGQSLIQLSMTYYGTKKLWPYIAAYNHILQPDKVSVGQEIKIPELANR